MRKGETAPKACLDKGALRLSAQVRRLVRALNKVCVELVTLRRRQT